MKKIISVIIAFAMITGMMTGITAVHAAVDEISTADELKTALANGGDYVLSDSITVSEDLETAKDFTLDLNGKTLDLGSGSLNLKNVGDYKLSNGTIKSTIQGTTNGAISLTASDSKLELSDVNVTSGTIALYITAGIVTVEGGIFENTVNNVNDFGIVAASGGTITITDSAIKYKTNNSGSGVAGIRAAPEITGGTCNPVFILNKVSILRNGTSFNKGRAISVPKAGNYALITINGGKYEGTNDCIYWQSHTSRPLTITDGKFTTVGGTLINQADGTITVTGGTFGADPTVYVDTAKYDITQSDDDTTWTVTEKKEATPTNITVNYADETLEGFAADTDYKINGEAVTLNNNTFALGDNITDTEHSIAVQAAAKTYADSDPLNITIKARPLAPTVTDVVTVTQPTEAGGKGTIEAKVNGVEYSTTSATEGFSALDSAQIDGGATVYIRMAAVNSGDEADKKFHSLATSVTLKKMSAVTLNTDGGGFAQPSDNITAYYEGEALQLPTDLTKQGYTFGGWYATSDSAKATVTEISAEATGALSFTAEWTVNQYKITFEENGGDDVEDIESDYNANVNLPTPARTGYTFNGWKEDNEHTYDGGDEYTITDNVTLTAQWTVNTPNLAIDYEKEQLTGFGDGSYTIAVDSEAAVSLMVTDGKVDITPYIGKSISIVAKGSGSDIDSEPWTATIKSRPEKPTVTVVQPTTIGGKGKITGLAATMEYRIKDSNDDWTTSNGSDIDDIPVGTKYEIRTAAVKDMSFASEATETTPIAAYSGTQETINANSITVDFINEKLQGLAPNGSYTIEGANKTADENGKIDIDSSWIGETISIVKKGNGTTTTDSASYSLAIAPRLGAPALTINNATESVTIPAGYTYTDPADNSTVKTTTAETVVTVPAEASMTIEIAATAGAFKSASQTLTAPARANDPEVSVKDYEAETLNTTATMQYWYNNTWKDCTADMLITEDDFGYGNGETATTVKFRTKAADEQYASKGADFEIPARGAAPTTPQEGAKATADDVEDGTITGVTDAMEYKSGTTWTKVTGTTVTGLAPGTYSVRYSAVAGTSFASLEKDVTVGVAGKHSVIFKDGVGNTLATITVTDGATAVVPNDITVPDYSNDKYTYTWNNGWNKSLENITDDTTITATYIATPREYAITYNTNGGILSDEYNNSTYTYSDSDTTALAAEADITKVGYTFDGWYADADYSGTAVTEIPADTIGAKSYSAKWKLNAPDITVNYVTEKLTGFAADNTYAIAISGGSSSDKTGAEEYAVAEYVGKTITVVQKAKEAYEIDSDGLEVTVGARYAEPVSGTDFTFSQPVEVGGDGSLAASAAGLEYKTDNGNWADLSTATLTPGSTVYVRKKASQADSKFAGQNYTAIVKNRYAVTLNLNGGTITSGSDVTSALDDETITLPTVERSGYTFDGWYTDNQFETPYVSAPAKDTLTLYANWTQDVAEKVTVTFNAGDGELTGEASKTITKGSKLTEIPTASKTGYTFTAWSDGTNSYTAEELLNLTISTSTDFTAEYTINKYTITWLDEDDSKLGESTVEHGTVPSYPNATPTKADTDEYTYTFNKWTPDIVAATESTSYKASYTAVSKDAPKSYLPLLNTFDAVLQIEKTAGENGSVVLTAEAKADNTPPTLNLYVAIYNSDNSLKSVSLIPFAAANDDYKASLTKPTLESGESFKIMLWTDRYEPVIGVISSEDFFN